MGALFPINDFEGNDYESTCSSSSDDNSSLMEFDEVSYMLSCKNLVMHTGII